MRGRGQSGSRLRRLQCDGAQLLRNHDRGLLRRPLEQFLALIQTGIPLEFFQVGWDPMTGRGTPVFPKLLALALAP